VLVAEHADPDSIEDAETPSAGSTMARGPAVTSAVAIPASGQRVHRVERPGSSTDVLVPKGAMPDPVRLVDALGGPRALVHQTPVRRVVLAVGTG
jgi:hypothetical protein